MINCLFQSVNIEEIIQDHEKKIRDMESSFKEDKRVLYEEAKHVEDLVEK